MSACSARGVILMYKDCAEGRKTQNTGFKGLLCFFVFFGFPCFLFKHQFTNIWSVNKDHKNYTEIGIESNTVIFTEFQSLSKLS